MTQLPVCFICTVDIYRADTKTTVVQIIYKKLNDNNDNINSSESWSVKISWSPSSVRVEAEAESDIRWWWKINECFIAFTTASIHCETRTLSQSSDLMQMSFTQINELSSPIIWVSKILPPPTVEYKGRLKGAWECSAYRNSTGQGSSIPLWSKCCFGDINTFDLWDIAIF